VKIIEIQVKHAFKFYEDLRNNRAREDSEGIVVPFGITFQQESIEIL